MYSKSAYESLEYWWEWDNFHYTWNYMTGYWTNKHGEWTWVYAIYNSYDHSWDWYSSSKEYHNNAEYEVVRWVDKYNGNSAMGWYEYDDDQSYYIWCEKHTIRDYECN